MALATACTGQIHDSGASGDARDDRSVPVGDLGMPDADDAELPGDTSAIADLLADAVDADVGDAGDADAVVEACLDTEREFVRDVWARVLVPNCQSCHNPTGIASATRYVLVSPEQDADHIARNRATVEQVGALRQGGEPLMLLKASGSIVHGGGLVLPTDSEDFQALDAFLVRLGEAPWCPAPDESMFAQHLEVWPAQSLLRRVTLDLAGRLPTEAERTAVGDDPQAIAPLLDAMTREPGFYDIFVDEGLNDVFHLAGTELNAARLDGNDFPDHEWYTDIGLPEDERVIARDDAAYGLRYAPYALIRYILAEDRPFSEILTADYTMVNYSSARSLGVGDQVDFGGVEDRHAFAPAVLGKPSAMVDGDRYPHAGIVSTHAYLSYYTTTDTNRNRGRARVFYEQFLDTNLLEIAPQGGGDSQAVVNTENPVRDAAECNVCHYVVDPAAGAFQNIDDTASWRPRRDGWYTDSFPPGLEGIAMPPEASERALQWLAAQAVADPRFARAMVSNVYEAILGRRPMAMPRDPTRPDYLGRLRAYSAQQRWLREVEQAFVASDHDVRDVIERVVMSPYYMASSASIDLDALSPDERGLYAELGLARLLTPEQLDRKITAIFGEQWQGSGGNPMLLDARQLYMLYAGVDSKSILDRLREMSPMMASIATIMSGDVACRLAIKRDFERPPAERLLFGDIDLTSAASLEPGVVRGTIVHLYDRVLGQAVAADSPEVDIAYALFTAVQHSGAGALSTGDESESLRSFCGSHADPHYSARAWMAVVTFMLEDWTFLYH